MSESIPPHSDEPLIRKAIHSRAINFISYERSDGLWDIEGVIEDRKTYEFQTLEKGAIPVGAPYHCIRVTLTVDDSLRVVHANASMDATPFNECSEAPTPLQKLVGLTLARGWRKAVDAALERTSACTHMREMLYAAPSAAIQAIPGYRAFRDGKRWPPEFSVSDAPPHFVGGCVSWRKDGAVVMRHYPQFHQHPASSDQKT